MPRVNQANEIRVQPNANLGLIKLVQPMKFKLLALCLSKQKLIFKNNK